MGFEDRDYVRERARERAESRGAVFLDRSRPRSRKSGLERWLEAPFRNQKIALAMAVCGIILITGIPASIISSLAPSGPIDVDPDTMMTSMIGRGIAGGAMTIVPAARLFGLTMIASSAIALIRGRRRWGYSTVIKDPNVAGGIGSALIAIVIGSIVTQGVWINQARKAAEAGTRIATGQNTTLPTISSAPPTDRQPTPQSIQIQPVTVTPGLKAADLPPDRPFPNNGTFERSLPLQGKIARMTFANRSQNNAIVVWLYNMNDGKGDHEALRLYLTAGQSAPVDLPAFDYRMAIYEAHPSLGLDRGFGTEARPKDLGLVDLKTPADALSQQPVGSYSGYGTYYFRPGIYAVRH